MHLARSKVLRLRAKGPLACFTRPEFKAERMSYPVITPSAARGLIEAVLWKPAIMWKVERILVLEPIAFISLCRNEVKKKGRLPSEKEMKSGGRNTHLYVDDMRVQRNTIALTNVHYVIEARFTMTAKAGLNDNVNKFEEIFERRMSRGECFHQPYFGCREFAAYVDHVSDDDDVQGQTIKESRSLGLMLWDITFGDNRNEPRLFAPQMKNGIIDVPDDPESTLAGGVF